MIARIAASLVLLSMLILLYNTFEMDGHSAILFSFVGHPLLVVGLVLGFVALYRRLTREAEERRRAEEASGAG